jgi:hypothetical protein
MKRKWIFGILTVLMICLILSLSQGADKFYYGSWGGKPERDFPFIKDSLRFNIVVGDAHSSTIDSFVNHSLRAMVGNWGCGATDQYSPYRQAGQSHYTMWEAEGLEGSYYKLRYNGGTLVNDAFASGGKAMQFGGPAPPRLIQWGPTYSQEPKDGAGYPIEYTAVFRLKYLLSSPRGAMVPKPPADSLCRIMVVDSGTVLNYMKIYKRDFPGMGGTYDTFTLEYTVPNGNQIEFQIYWFGNAVLYVDYVKVYDDFGRQLIDDTTHLVANQIKAYVNQSWVHTTIPETGDTVVYRWFLEDQPGYIDQLQPARYVDSLLRVVSSERVGFQAICRYMDTTFMHEYFLRHDPEEYQVDIYPTYYWGRDSSGVRFQDSVSVFTKWLNTCKNQAEEQDKDLWVTIQTHFWGNQVADPDSCSPGPAFPYGGNWYCSGLIRPPTGNEVRLQTFLALCYGADAILHFSYPSRIDSTDLNQLKLELGLYDHIADTTTEMWREIAHFTGPRMEKLGPVFHQLTWQGACSGDSVGSFILRNEEPSYIDSMVGTNPDSIYVQVGFFDDYDTAYFMLVNRRCLSTEEQNVTVYIDSAEIGNKKMWYVIDQYSHDTTFTGAINGAIPFTTHLEPGEGKLFRLVPFPESTFHGTAHPLTWQGEIMIDGDVTVDSIKTLVIRPPAKITFYANTDVMHTWDTTDCDFIVNGGLRAVGTETDSIIFTSTENNPDDWEGIYVDKYSTMRSKILSHCVIEYSYGGIQLLDNYYSYPDTVSNSRFTDNQCYGIRNENPCARIIDNLICNDTTESYDFCYLC